MSDFLPAPPNANDNSALSSPAPLAPDSNRYKRIIAAGIPFVLPTILALLVIIFLAILPTMPWEFGLNLGSSTSSPNIPTSRVTAPWNIALYVKKSRQLITEHPRMKLLLSFKGQLILSRPSLILPVTQGSGNVAPLQAEALSTLSVVFDLDVKSLVSTLKGGEVTMDMVVKAKHRVH